MNYDNLTGMTAYPNSLDAMMFDPRAMSSMQMVQTHHPRHPHPSFPPHSTVNSMALAVSEEEEDQPKRPLSAYNIFFQVERQRLISEEPAEGPYTRAEVYSINLDKATRIEKSKRPHRKMHGRITFIELAKTIASKWKSLNTPEKRLFEERAGDEKRKYAIELEDYLLRQVPTQQVKKRLSALRRGSLSKYIQGRSTADHTAPPAPAAVSPSKDAVVPREHSPQQRMITPVNSRRASNTSFVRATSTNNGSIASPVHSKVRMERGRNLERLYQMQIQLYNEQMRIQAEYNREEQHSASNNSGGMLPNERASFHHQDELMGQQTQHQRFHEVSRRGFGQQQQMAHLDDAPEVPNMFEAAPPPRRFVSGSSLDQQHNDIGGFAFSSLPEDDQPACHPLEYAQHHEDGRVSPLAVDPFA